MKKKLILFFIITITFLIPLKSFAKKKGHKKATYTLKKTDVDFSSKKPDIDINILPKNYQKEIKILKEDYSLYRRVESVKFDTDSKTYAYLINDLPFAGRISKGLKFTNYIITKKKDGSIHFDDKKNMQADVKIIYKDSEKVIFFGKCLYKGKLIGDVSGDMLLILNFKDNKNQLDNQIQFFMKFKNSFMSTTVKVFAFVFNSMLKKRVNHYLSIIKNISELIKNEPLLVYVSLKKNKIAKRSDIIRFKKKFLKK